MRKDVKFIRFTCDVCKKNFDINEIQDTKDIPTKELVLPVKYYTETGSFVRVTTKKVDVCQECLEKMENDLSQLYDMSSIAYGGVNIKRKGGAE